MTPPLPFSYSKSIAQLCTPSTFYSNNMTAPTAAIEANAIAQELSVRAVSLPPALVVCSTGEADAEAEAVGAEDSSSVSVTETYFCAAASTSPVTLATGETVTYCTTVVVLFSVVVIGVTVTVVLTVIVRVTLEVFCADVECGLYRLPSVLKPCWMTAVAYSVV